MPFPITVLDPFIFPSVTPRRVTLVRFARAITGFAEKDAPDMDDRGSTIRAGHGQAAGPVVGLIGNVSGVANQTAKIKVMRDRIDSTAQIFPTLDSTTDVTLVHPAPGQPLNPADVPAVGGAPERKADTIHLEVASTGSGDPETKLKLHFGAVDGPVIAELGVVVYAPKTIFVQVHKVTINGPAHALTPAAAAPTMPDADIRTVFRRMDRIYTQAGIRVILRSTFLNETVNGYTERGTVTLPNGNDHLNAELQNILNQNPDKNSMNAYIFNQFRDITQLPPNDLLVLGIAFSRRQANANPPVGAFPAFPGCQAGFTLQASSDLFKAAHTAAHEIGHTLELEHYGNRNPEKNEIWSNRNLMKNTVNTFSNAAITNVGYLRFVDGSRRSGSWLGTKTITTSSLGQPDQIKIMRTATANGSFKPVRLP